MLNVRSALKNGSICKSLTGLTVKEFKDLLPEFEKAFMDDVNSKPRERAYGGGSKSANWITEMSNKDLKELFSLNKAP